MEIGHDDTVHLWGTIKSFDPHDFFQHGLSHWRTHNPRAWLKSTSLFLGMS